MPPAMIAIAGMSLGDVPEQEEQHPFPNSPPAHEGRCLQTITRSLLTTEKGDFQTYSRRTTVQIIELGLRQNSLININAAIRSYTHSVGSY